MAIQFVYFDCMDTLVQMDIPSMEIYPHWAYVGATQSQLWSEYSTFREAWGQHRRRFVSEHGGLREVTIRERIRDMVYQRLASLGWSWPNGRVESVVGAIHRAYWTQYREASFVHTDVHETLSWLRWEKGYRLGVLSNFMVPGGIGELLARHDLSQYFEVVLVSCNLGWKKPAESVYRAAVAAAGVEPSEIVFVGDNQLADFDGPRLLGLNPVLFDPEALLADVQPSIRKLRDLRDLLA